MSFAWPWIAADRDTLQVSPEVGLSIAENVKSSSTQARTWGTSPNGSTILLTGTYASGGEVTRPLQDVLPNVIAIRSEKTRSHVAEMLAAEIASDEPGQVTVLDRLLDLPIVTVLRAWFRRPEAEGHPWYQAHGDPIVGSALRLIHHNPSYPWTIANLASSVGVSRASFARKFTQMAGQPPTTYLTSWRLSLGADLLSLPDNTVSSVAHELGYRTAFTFSTAFKRTYGVSPSEYRRIASSPDSADGTERRKG